MNSPAYRREADQRSNLTEAAQLPAWANNGTEYIASGTSIFDPVLCELAYRWFAPPSGSVLDPFAGGSVRGIVAARLGLQYTGIDLSERQVLANREQGERICGGVQPRWLAGDSREVKAIAPGVYDFIFSSPPYGDLERYSDDPLDLSTLDYAAFLQAFRGIVTACVGLLRPERFACVVVGDFRDRRGFYRGFVGETVAAFQDAGMPLYNDAILITAVGSLALRVTKAFVGYRKLGKTHQNVLVFYKGDPQQIKREFPAEIEFGMVAEEATAEDPEPEAALTSP